MLKFYLIAIFNCLAIFTNSMAQTQGYFEENWAQKKVFLDWTGKGLTTAENARFYRVINMTSDPDNLYEVKDYLMDGLLVRVAHYADSDLGTLQGECIDYYHTGRLKSKGNYLYDEKQGDWDHWHPDGKFHMTVTYFGTGKYQVQIVNRVLDRNGNLQVSKGNGLYKSFYPDFRQLEEEGLFSHGLKSGEWKGYYLNGSVKYKERYKKGILKKGIFTSRNGKKYHYKQLEKAARPRHGFDSLENYLKARLKKYSNPKQTQLAIQFRIESDGNLSEFQILHSVDPGLDQQVIDLIQNFGMWYPREERGYPVASYTTYALNFLTIISRNDAKSN